MTQEKIFYRVKMLMLEVTINQLEEVRNFIKTTTSTTTTRHVNLRSGADIAPDTTVDLEQLNRCSNVSE